MFGYVFLSQSVCNLREPLEEIHFLLTLQDYQDKISYHVSRYTLAEESVTRFH